MANRLRKARWIVGGALLLGTLWVGSLLVRVDRRRTVAVEEKQAAPPPAAEPVEERPESETGCSEGFVVERLGSMRGLEAALACRQADGTSLLEGGVSLSIDASSGATYEVRADRGVLSAAGAPATIRLVGNVEVRGSDGFELDGQELEIHREQQRIVSRQPVVLRRSGVTGEAGGLDHDWESKDALLVGSPVLRLQGDERAGGDVTVRGETIRYLEGERLLEVREAGRIDFADGWIAGARMDVVLAEGAGDVRRIDAAGGAETWTRRAAPGAPQAVASHRLRGGRITHEFGPSSVLRRVDARGAAALTSGEGAGGTSPSRVLTGERVVLSFAPADEPWLQDVTATGSPARMLFEDPSGRRQSEAEDLRFELDPTGALRRLVGKGAARASLGGGAVARTLSAASFEATFAPGEPAALEALDFEGEPGQLMESFRDPEGRPVERRVHARTGRVRLDREGTLTQAEFDGAVEIATADVVARGGHAETEGRDDVLVLTGDPSLELPGRTSHGERIVHDRRTGTIEVSGRQHTIVTDPGPASGIGAVASEEEPILVSSEKLVISVEERQAVYSSPSGGHRPDMRQGDVGLRADVLTVDDQAGQVLATGDVESKLRLARADGTRARNEASLFDPAGLIVGHSESLVLDRTQDVARYRGEVELVQGTTSLTADEVEVGLKPGGGEVDYLKARGRALYVSTDMEAEGERIDYRAETGEVRIEGGLRPARARRGGGTFARGGVLTMLAGDDGIAITAPYGGRTRGGSLAPVKREAP